MSEKFKKLKDIYENIYQNTLEISSLVDEGNLDEIETILGQRGKLIKKASNIALNSDFSEEEKKEIDEYAKKIRPLENKNLEEMKKKLDTVRKELTNVNMNKKLASAYKYNKEPQLGGFDTKE